MANKVPTPRDYSFGDKEAEDLYEELRIGREQVIEKARDISKISIPTLMPPTGYKPGDNLPPPNQSINASMIAVLASRVMLTALPPGFPMLKYNIIEHRMQEAISQNVRLYSDTLLALSRREKANRDRMESTGIRSAYVDAVENLLGSGNILWRHIDIDHPSTHKMDTYVVRRAQGGEMQEVVLCLGVTLSELKPSVRAFIKNLMLNNPSKYGNDDREREHQTVYACQKLWWRSDTEKVWLYWEEFEGQIIPDSEAMVPYDAPIMYAAWLKPSYGNNWGTSYCELYEGDMWLVENAYADLRDIADAAALVWLLLKPGGVTSKKVLEKAENVRIMYGDAQDITVFRLDKNADGSFIQTLADGTTQRLGRAFLSTSSVQRSGERVTAEEWRSMTGELDMAMGGLYAVFAQGLGKNIVSRFVALQEQEDPTLKPLPKGLIRLGVITGMDAISVNDELQNLENALGTLVNLFGKDIAALFQYLVPDEVIRRVLAGNTVKPDGLLKDEKQQASEAADAKNQVMQGKVMDAALPPIAKAGADAVIPQVAQQALEAIKRQQGAPTNGG